MSKINVAIFASAFHPFVGGVEEVCRQTAAEYRRRDMGVAVFTNRWPRNLPDHETIEGIDVHRLAMRVPAAGVKAKLSWALTAGTVGREMLRRLGELQPNVLHVHCVSCNAAYALVAQRKLRVPLVATLHGELYLDSAQIFQRTIWAKRILRETLDGADVVTACSQTTLADAEAWLGRPFGKRGRVIYNGIPADDTEATPFTHPRPYVFAIGRHVPQKGFDFLLQAIAQLMEKPQFIHDLVLAGDGVEHSTLKSLASKLGIASRVSFVGKVDHAAAMGLFQGCSFVVVSSRNEAFPVVNLEAMAAGKPVVATRVGGVPEIVTDGENGLLVPAQDAAALAAAIGRMAGDAALRDRLGRCGRERVKGFTWPAIAEQYIGVYEQAIDASGRVDRVSRTATREARGQR